MFSLQQAQIITSSIYEFLKKYPSKNFSIDHYTKHPTKLFSECLTRLFTYIGVDSVMWGTSCDTNLLEKITEAFQTKKQGYFVIEFFRTTQVTPTDCSIVLYANGSLDIRMPDLQDKDTAEFVKLYYELKESLQDTETPAPTI